MKSLKGRADQRELTALLSDLVRIESINPDYPGGSQGEANLLRYAADYFDQNGIVYHIQEVLPGRHNLIACLPGRTRGGVCLEAHMDTVTAAGMTIDPYDPVVKDGCLYGRGSCDTKGSLACMMYSMVLLKRLNIVPETDIYLAAVVDEEFRYRGVLRLLESGFPCRYALVGEPTGLDIATACKGVMRFPLVTAGKAGHGARPEEGHNAIQDMGEVLHLIQNQMIPELKRRTHPMLGTPTVNVGVIQGGTLVNIIPDQCRVEVDYRTLPGQTYETIAAEFYALVSEQRKRDPLFQFTVGDPLLTDYAMETPSESGIVKAAVAASDDILGSHTLKGVSYCCDGTKFYRAGVETIIFGPGDIAQAHAACEFIDLSHLAPAAEMYAQISAALPG